MSKPVAYHFFLTIIGFLLYLGSSAQNDTIKPFVPVDTLTKKAPVVQNKQKADSVALAHSPRKAAMRSAIIPGWGQAYNKKYWKIPIVYGALGTTAAVFFYNLTNYKDLRIAYKAKYKVAQNPPDSSDWNLIKPNLMPLDMQTLRFYRDQFRRDIDYSVLVFFLLWGVNVVDATVDAHLKTFDVSPDLSFQLKFGHSQMAGTNGLSLVLAFK
ncbi:MAG: DUF5683 domain-containing protein [Candidatus Dadabacteria bacterium]